jgi:hypothetical protein
MPEVYQISTYIADDSVTIVTSHEVLHRTCGCVLELIPTYEVVCEVVFCGIGGGAVRNGHSAIRMRDTIPVYFGSGHDGELTARLTRAEKMESPVESL